MENGQSSGLGSYHVTDVIHLMWGNWYKMMMHISCCWFNSTLHCIKRIIPKNVALLMVYGCTKTQYIPVNKTVFRGWNSPLSTIYPVFRLSLTLGARTWKTITRKHHLSDRYVIITNLLLKHFIFRPEDLGCFCW